MGIICATYYTQRNRVKEIRSFLLFTILSCFALLSLTGCEDKKVQEPLIPVENSTEVCIQKEKQEKPEVEKPEVKKVEPAQEIKENPETKEETVSENSPVAKTSADAFTLIDIRQNSYTFTVNNQKIDFHDIDQSVVVINFFSTLDSPCCGALPYLSDLQKRYKENIFIAGVPLNDIKQNNILKQFISKYHIDYFISNSTQNNAFATQVAKELQLPEDLPTPLTVIYKDGDYYTHYEGAVPMEMINHDIKQVIK